MANAFDEDETIIGTDSGRPPDTGSSTGTTADPRAFLLSRDMLGPPQQMSPVVNLQPGRFPPFTPPLPQQQQAFDSLGSKPPPIDINAIIQGARDRAADFETKGQAIVDAQTASGEKEKAELDRLSGLRQRAFTPIYAPDDPRFESMPKPPDAKLQDPLKAFGSPAVFLATVGSLFTRTPLKTAMDAGAAAMNGFQKGDQAQLESNRELWQEATKVAAENNRNELERYNAAWKRTEHNATERAAALNEIAIQQKDIVMKAAIDQGNFDLAYKLLEDRSKAQDHLDEVLIREQDRRESMDIRRARADQFLNPGDTTNAAKEIYEYRAAPVTGYALKTPWGQQVMDQVEAMGQAAGKPYDASNWYGKRTAETTRAAAEPRALAGTLTTLEKQKAAIEQYEENARKNGRVLKQLANNVDKTGVPVIERWLRDGEAALGDPNVKAFVAQLTAYRNEVAKIITNPNLSGALTVNAQVEAEKFVNGNDSARTINDVIDLFEGDFDRRKHSLIDEMNQVRGQLGLKPYEGGTPPGGDTQLPASLGGPQQGGEAPPASMLKEGFNTTFKNGQVWTLQNGQPVQVK